MKYVFKSFLKKYFEDFIRFREASNKTSVNFERYLYYFDRHIQSNYPLCMKLTQEMADTWCKKRDSENESSCNSRCMPTIGFIKYLIDRDLTEIAIPELPKAFKSNYIPHSFTKDELIRFFNKCDNLECRKNHPIDLIRRLEIPTIYRLLYSTGIRTCEALWLKRKDVNFDDGVISIEKSKGHNQRYVVLHDSMKIVLKKYDEAMNRLLPDREVLFPNVKDRTHSDKWLSDNFCKIWDEKNYARSYDFRHNYAIHNINKWIHEGFDFDDKLLYLSKSMGHKTVENTKYYYSIVPSLGNILEKQCEEGINEVLPEVY